MARFLDFEGVDAVVFDCDGVLVDSEPVSEQAWRHTLYEYGVDLGGDFVYWVGKTDQALASHYAPDAGVSADELLDRCAGVLTTMLEADGIPVFPDSVQAVDRAAAAGLALGVASNSERWRLDAILKTAGLIDRFGVSVTSDEVAHPKPWPDIYLQAAYLIGVDTSRCLVVEDSPSGVAAARAAGMRVVAIDRGVFGPEELAPATRVVEVLAEGQ